jgi:hypothetical protein
MRGKVAQCGYTCIKRNKCIKCIKCKRVLRGHPYWLSLWAFAPEERGHLPHVLGRVQGLGLGHLHYLETRSLSCSCF